MKQNVPYGWVFLLIGVIVAVIGLLVTAPAGSEDINNVEKTSETASHAMSGETHPIVRAQRASGVSAVFAGVQPSGAEQVQASVFPVDQPVRVVVYADRDGVPGAVIGHSSTVSETGVVSIPVDSPLSTGSVYYAVLHEARVSDGFDAQLDSPLTNAEGHVVMMSFTAHSE